MPFFIDRSGQTVLPPVYKYLSFLNYRKAIVTTITDKQGIIDIQSKQLIVDTLFAAIRPFDCGVAIVTKAQSTVDYSKPKFGVIDTTGKFVVPFGRYEEINDFSDGVATVFTRIPDLKTPGKDGVIDAKGNIVFERLRENHTYISGNFRNGYAQMALYKYWIPEEKGILSSGNKYYDGYINLKGEVVIDDTTYSNVTDFSEGRAFIRVRGGDYILVDRAFKHLGSEKFLRIVNNEFQNGYAIVSTEDGDGIIDTSGNFVVQSKYEEIYEFGIIDDYFFFSEEVEVGEEDKVFSGVSSLNGKTIVKARMEQFDRTGFHNGLLKAVVSDKFIYIDKKGRYVWREKVSKSKTLRKLNIDYMNRGYFTAYSTKGVKSNGEYAGWAVSGNTPKKITDKVFHDNMLAVTIDTTRIDTFHNRFSGFGLFISNTTADTIRFNAQDSRLYMKLQALNNRGQWQDIEYMPSSWCGNSYHDVALEPNAFWRFVIPDYDGEVQTKIRAELQYIDKDHPEENKVVYSNEIIGRINPGQFWHKITYYPGGLMDPYND